MNAYASLEDERFARGVCDRVWSNRVALRRPDLFFVCELIERLNANRGRVFLSDGDRVQLADIDLRLKAAGI